MLRQVTVQVLPAPQVSFEGTSAGELTSSSTVRACAGGIDDHLAGEAQYRAHTRFVTAKAERDGQPAPNLNLIFKFANNVGHDYSNDPVGVKPEGWTSEQIRTARLLDSDNPPVWKEELARTTNEQAQVALSVKSSDVISQPTLEAHWTNEQGEDVIVGSIECDFAAAETLRRFVPLKLNGEPVMPDEDGDTGWIFDFPNLLNPENQEKITPAKLYRKFRRDRDKGDDVLLADGHSNWHFVNGHIMHIYVAGVKLYGNPDDASFYDGPEVFDTPANLRHYAFIKDQRTSAESPDLNTVDRVTSGDGATPQVYVKAGPDIENVAIVWVDADDLTQWKQ